MTTTWATTTNPDAVRTDDNAGNGDIVLVPMIEVIMPYEAGHYANLPITTTAPATRVLGEPVANWLDTDFFEPAGISVTDYDLDAGTLSTYLPVVTVSDRNDQPVAFTSRMLYKPSQGPWGAAHQYRLVWLVQMLTDQCIDPADDLDTCEREDVISVVHIYEDDWVLTGLQVSEQHGAQTAIVYEDPDLDLDLTADDQLWVASWNLGNTFLRGRDCETTVGDDCVGDGVRDVRLDNLSTEISSWFTSDYYLSVDIGTPLENEAALVQVAATAGMDILTTQFAGYESATLPTLMYVTEIQTRRSGLLAATENSGVIHLDMDPATVLSSTQASINWKTHQYVGGSWQVYEPSSYLDLLSYRLSQQDYFKPIDNSQDNREVAQGRLMLAQLYYASMFEGVSTMVQVGQTLLTPERPDVPDTSYEPIFIPGSTTGATIILSAMFYFYAQIVVAQNMVSGILFKFLSAITSVQTYSFGAQAGYQAMIEILGKIGPLMKVLFATALIGAALVLAGYFGGNDGLYRAGLMIMAAVTVIVTLMQLLLFWAAVQVAVAQGATLSFSLLASVGQGFQAVGKFSLILTVVFIWVFAAIQITSKKSVIKQNVVIAIAIVLTIIVVILFILSLVGLGPLVVLLLLIDALFLIFDAKGPTQLLVEWTANLIYDVDFLITNVGSSNRLDMDIKPFEFADIRDGFAVSNNLTVTVGVTPTLRYKKAFNFPRAAEYTVMRYTLQNSPVDQHDSLAVGDMENEWINAGNRSLYVNETLSTNVSLASVGTGLNQKMPIYLTEAMLLSYRGCWLSIASQNGEICTWEHKKQSVHIDLGETLTFDILPDTVAEFAALNWNNNSELTFLDQIDFDGDGLTTLLGTDPNDALFDTDGDGLSDFYEAANGFNYWQADEDLDGLSDWYERLYYTNAANDDTDGDGLSDLIEAQEGWLVSYGPGQVFRVWSDPFLPDTDLDGLSDWEEFVFGLNPRVKTDPSVIDTLVEIDDLTVREVEAPMLLMRFEEFVDSSAFLDSSGQNLSVSRAGACLTADTCPLSGVEGRYGRGLEMDGNDVILFEHPVTDFSDDFSIGMWIKTTAIDDRIIFAKQDGDLLWEDGETVFQLRASGEPVLTRKTAGGDLDIWGNVAVNDGEWHHVMAVWDYDPVTGGGTARMYIDGDNHTDGAQTDFAYYPDNDVFITQIGGFDDNANNNHDGSFDELIVFDRALSSAELNGALFGGYNVNDSYIVRGATLSYQATITNSSGSDVDGIMVGNTQHISPAIPTAAAAFSFEENEYLTYFPNSTGEHSPVYCTADDTCPSWIVSDTVHTALHFDGVDDALKMGTISADQTDKYTIGFWVRVDAVPPLGERAYILDTVTDEAGALDIYIDEDGKFAVSLAGTNQPLTAFSASLIVGQWYHLMVTRNGQVLRLQVGNSTGGTSQTVSPNVPNTLVGPGLIGNNITGTAPFSGAIESMVFYNGAYLRDDVTQIFNRDYYIGITDTAVADSIPTLILSLEDPTWGNRTQFDNDVFGAAPLICDVATCPTVEKFGAVNEAISFDGVNDALTMTTDALFYRGEIEMWVKLDALPASGQKMYLIDSETPSGFYNYRVFSIYINDAGEIVTESEQYDQIVRTMGPSNYSFDGNLGQWVHLRFLIRSADGWYELYIDDQLDTIDTVGSGPVDYQFRNAVIGKTIADTDYFQGDLDEFMIIDRTANGLKIEKEHYRVSFDALPANVVFLDTPRRIEAAKCYNWCPASIYSERFHGDALYFDGVDDYIELDELDFSQGDYTISFLFHSDVVTEPHVIFAGVDRTAPPHVDGIGVSISLQPTNTVEFRHNFPPGSGSMAVLTGDYYPNAWQHVLAINKNKTIYLYVNGQYAGSQNHGLDANVPLDVIIGREGDMPQAYFEGRFDEMVIIPAAVEEEALQTLRTTQYPAIDLPDEFVSFNLPPATTAVVSGTAYVNERGWHSEHLFEQEVEASLTLQGVLSYTISDPQVGSLVYYYPFEEGPTSSTFVEAATGVTGVCSDSYCPVSGLRGMVGHSAYFDGEDDYVEAVGGSSPNDLRSIAVWVKGERGTIVDLRENWSNTYTGWQLDFDQFQLAIEGIDGVEYPTIPLNLPENEWVHIVGVFDYDQLQVYLNGELYQTVTETLDSSGSWRTDDPIIGRNRLGGDAFRGYIDDLRIYDQPLSATDVATLYETSIPQLQFEFDEAEEATGFLDRSPNGFVGYPSTFVAFDGEIVSDPIPGVAGRIGNGALFDGDTAAIRIPEAQTTTNFIEDFTIMTWIKTSQSDAGIVVESDGDSNWERYEKAFYIEADGTLNFVGWGNDYIRSATVITDNVWHHVALTWNKSSSTGRIYVDGVDVTTQDNYVPNNADLDTNTLWIGAPNYSEAPNHFNGKIDELQFYTRPLFPGEIYANYLRELRWYRALGQSYLILDRSSPTIDVLSDNIYGPNGYNQLAIATRDRDTAIGVVQLYVYDLETSTEIGWFNVPLCADSQTSDAAWCPYFDGEELGGEGRYYFAFIAYDAVGNSGVAEQHFYIDGTPPLIDMAYMGGWEALLVHPSGDALHWLLPLSGNISDPILPDGFDGSGVDPDSVFVSVTDDRGVLLGGAPQKADVEGSGWSIDYEIFGPRPTGRYTITVTAEDMVGNYTATAKTNNKLAGEDTILLDGRPAVAELISTLAPTQTGSFIVSGIVGDQPDWGGAVAQYHFEDTMGTFTMTDHSDSGNDASCTTCPTLSSDGVFRNSAQFDGVDDYLIVPYLFNPIDMAFSIATWVKVDDFSVSRPIIQQLDGTGVGRTLLYISTSGQLRTNLGMGGGGALGTLMPNQWYHVAMTYQNGEVVFYIDGVENNRIASQAEAADGDFYVGRNKSGGYFMGLLDELNIFDRALTANEVYAMAQDVVSGVNYVDLSLAPATFDNTPVTYNWVAVAPDDSGEPMSLWSHQITGTYEDFYQLDIRGVDMFDNIGQERTVWRGIVDTMAPRINFTAEHLGVTSGEETEFAFVIDDLFLDGRTVTTPCGTESLVEDYQAEPLTLKGITGVCRLDGHLTGTFEVTACDQFGQCTTESVVLQANPVSLDVNILSPEPASSLNNTDAISITGGAYSQVGISSVMIYVNGGLVDTILPGGVNSFAWSTSWTPPTLGMVYTITAMVNSSNATMDTDQILINVWPAPIAPQVSIELRNSSDIQLDWLYEAANCNYAVYQSEWPYFTPSSQTIVVWGLADSDLSYLLEERVSSGMDWYYLVEGRNCGLDAAVSNETAVFTIDIYGGQ